jgi:SRSO17 transposase
VTASPRSGYRHYLGWHRHVTLVVLAQAFCTLLRLDPAAAAPA